MFTVACCLVVGLGFGLGLGLGLGLDLVSGWLVVMHTYCATLGCICHEPKRNCVLVQIN